MNKLTLMFSDMLLKIIDSIIPITIISLILLSIIIFLRIIFYLIIVIFSKFYLKRKKLKKKNLKPKTDIVIFKKEEEELYRDLKADKKQEQEEFNFQGVEKMNNNETMNEIDFTENARIVGIAKPIGFWTSLILGDQLSQILGRAQALNSRSHKGFWASMLEAQANGLGRQHGRNR